MKFIETQAQLDEIIKPLSQVKSLSIDTEADSLHHYYEKLCLIQISTKSEDYVIDTLAKLDFAQLVKVISEKPAICHGADFDLRMIHRFFGVEVKGVFDTMLAAQFIGYPRPSLVVLVEKHYNISLPKANQKADWSKRPLTDSMLEYAGNDSHYLLGLAEILEKEMKQLNRLAWFKESCAATAKQVTIKRTVDLDQLWRVKGSKDLKPTELVFLRELWQWREKESQRRDRPRFKVMGNDQMVRIAQWVESHSDEDITKCKDIPGSFNESKIKSIEKYIQKAMQTPVQGILIHKSKKPMKRFSTKQKNILALLKRERTKISDKLNMDPSLIVSNASMEAMIAKGITTPDALQKSGLLLNWQYELIGRLFIELLQPLAKPSVANK